MATTAMSYQAMNKAATSLTVHNLPVTADEEELQELFPAAYGVRLFRSQANPPNSQNACVLQFNTPDDCFKAFSEFQRGKELGGRMLRAELGEAAAARERFQPQTTSQQKSDSSYMYRQEQSEMYSSNKPHAARPQYSSSDNSSQGRFQEREKRNNETVLIVSNLPYSTTQQDLEREFQSACNITLNRDDRGRPSGVAQLSFRTREECDLALLACNNMTLNGRNLRGRLGTSQGSNNSDGMRRNYENKPSRGGRGESGNAQRSYDNRSDHGRMDMQRNYDSRPGQNRNEYGGMQRDFGNRQGNQNYNANRRDYDDGRRSGNSWRGGRGRGDGGNFNRGGQDRFGSRRERSPGQGEPVRGYAGAKGFRITSAVISGSGSPSSHSSSGSD